MIKIIIVVLIFALLVGCSNETATVNDVEVSDSKLTCPKGISHDPYPGRCPLYEDSNNDGYCDRV